MCFIIFQTTVHGFLYPKVDTPKTRKINFPAFVNEKNYIGRSCGASSTRLYKKWSPRWNPRPESDYFGGDENDDIFGGIIDSRSERRRKRGGKFKSRFHKSRFYSLQRFIVVSPILLDYFGTLINQYSIYSCHQCTSNSNYGGVKVLNIVCFLQQVLSAISYLPIINGLLVRNGYGNFGILEAIEPFILGSPPISVSGRATPSLGSRGRAYGQAFTVASSLGPFTMDFVNQRLLTRLQPHRYLTSGFLHASILHLLLNMRGLCFLPRWVENNGGSGNGFGGWCLYLTTYISSIVAGNLAIDYTSTAGTAVSTLYLGASGGICGLNGLMFAMLQRMGNSYGSMAVFKNMIFLFLFGTLVDQVSNAAHIGGFVCGALIGFLFGPNYSGGYRRTLISDDDGPTVDYRRLMGQGIGPRKGIIPLWYIWAGLGMYMLLQPNLQTIPWCIYTGLTSPGRLSGIMMELP